MARNPFRRVGSVRPGRTLFNLSYEKKLTCDMGQLIPVMCDEVVPGDFWKIGNQAVVRFQPLVAPVLHPIQMYVHYFFVPYRLLWEDWEDFITGGEDGEFLSKIPVWNPKKNGVGSLWDYLGFPTDVSPQGAFPLDFPRRAYNFVYNEYYRDQNLMEDIALDNEDVLLRCWEKDYFTSALPWQQRGTAPALPISGTTKAIWDDYAFTVQPPKTAEPLQFDTAEPPAGDDPVDNQAHVKNVQHAKNARAFFENNVVDLSVASTFDIADLRLAFQIQKWMERNARAGARYTEFLRAHFGESPRDDRLQRPEYIGGSKTPVIISEVLQTSSTDNTSPQGNLAGHGMTVSDSYCGKYRAQEYGLIIGIMSIMPKPSYQQGIDRQWLRQTKFDFYFPEFANLSEQAIVNAEICVLDDGKHNSGIFGYQGRYDEMRVKSNVVCGQLRDTFDYWHLGRRFDPSNPPVLNKEFLLCQPDKRIFASQTEPGLIVSFGNVINAFRPLPFSAEPGLIDHN